MDTILVGDIGGTKTRLHLFSQTEGPRAPLDSRTFSSQAYDSLEAILTAFAADCRHTISRAVFGVAGPVVAGRVEVTNLPWVIAASALARHLGIARVTLMNDLQAVAYALPFLDRSDRLTLNPGNPVPEGTRAVIAPGTGLGEAFLIAGPDGPVAYPTEGGHVSFAPRGETQIQLLRFMSERFDHVSFERVCSGIGIPHLYRFFKTLGRQPVSPSVDARVDAADDPTPIIVRSALETPSACPLCVQVLDTFVEILGAAAGNLALKTAALGGIYVGGGIPPRIPEQLRHPRFMTAFTDKGRMAGMLEGIPVHLIVMPEVGVFGAACYAIHIQKSE
ncbi:MAG: glucokinase [Desulfatitalea sp.]|nr:glucokinase [Desulfatitalea sp.]